MLITIADFLDSLWSTTSQIVTTTRYTPMSVPLQMPAEDAAEDYQEFECITVNGVNYIIPPVVLNRPPLFKNDDSPNYDAFPTLRSTVLVSQYTGKNMRTLLVDGMGVSRRSTIHGVTRDAAEAMITVHERIAAPGLSTDYEDLTINFFRGDGWVHITAIRDENTQVSVFHREASETMPISAEISMAYMHARTILLMFLAGNDVVYKYNEDALAGHLLAITLNLRGAA